MTQLERIGEFGDIRRAERGVWLFDRIVSTGSLVFRKVGGDGAGAMAAHRFLGSSTVTEREIVQTLGMQIVLEFSADSLALAGTRLE